MDDMKQYIEALKNGKGFDWIANYGYKLNKYELIDIIKELTFAIDDKLDKYDTKNVIESAAEELIELYENDEEEDQ